MICIRKHGETYGIKEEKTMKTKEELQALKDEAEALNKKLSELTDDEMEQVIGGTAFSLLDSFSALDNAIRGRITTISGTNEG